MSADIAYLTFCFDIYLRHIEVDVWRVRHTGESQLKFICKRLVGTRIFKIQLLDDQSTVDLYRKAQISWKR